MRDIFNLSLIQIINTNGQYTLYFMLMDSQCNNRDVYVCPNELDRNNLKQLIYFLGTILDDWTAHCSVSDYDDDELVVIANDLIERLSLLYSMKWMPCIISEGNHIVEETSFEWITSITNIGELQEWAKISTKAYLSKVAKKYAKI